MDENSIKEIWLVEVTTTRYNGERFTYFTQQILFSEAEAMGVALGYTTSTAVPRRFVAADGARGHVAVKTQQEQRR